MNDQQVVNHLIHFIMEMDTNSLLIAIAGPSCSGKTTLAKQLSEKLITGKIDHANITADDYFKDIDDPSLPRMNGFPLFDHPDAYDIDLLHKNVFDLMIFSKPVREPIYDLSKNKRMSETREIAPHRVIIVEGLFAIHAMAEIRKHIPALVTVYVDANYSTRLARRMKRDLVWIKNEVNIENLFKNTVEKCYLEWGTDQKKCADLIAYS